MKLALTIVGIVTAALIGRAVRFPSVDGDLSWQRWLGQTILSSHHLPVALHGETFTAAGSAWVPQEWAFSLLVAYSSAHGMDVAFHTIVALLAGACLAIVALRCRVRGATPVATAIVTLLAGIALFASFGVRAQVVGWFFLSLFLWDLDYDDRRLFWSIPLVILWSNLHASVMLAPLFAGLLALEGIARAGWDRPARLRCITAILMLPALCVNPLGVGLPFYAISLFFSPIRHYIQEWGSPTFADWSLGLAVLPLIGIYLLFGWRMLASGRREGWVFTFMLALVLAAKRNMAVFALAVAPDAAVALSAPLQRLIGRSPDVREPKFLKGTVVAGGMAVPIATLVFFLQCPQMVNAWKPPTAALLALERAPQEHRLFCENFAWCGAVLGSKRVRVFLDGRCDPFPVAVWNDYDAIAQLKPGWAGALRRRNVNAALILRGGVADRAFSTERNWVSWYRDARFVVYVRQDAALRAAPRSAARLEGRFAASKARRAG